MNTKTNFDMEEWEDDHIDKDNHMWEPVYEADIYELERAEAMKSNEDKEQELIHETLIKGLAQFLEENGQSVAYSSHGVINVSGQLKIEIKNSQLVLLKWNAKGLRTSKAWSKASKAWSNRKHWHGGEWEEKTTISIGEPNSFEMILKEIKEIRYT